MLSTAEVKKITLADIIARKEQIKEGRNKTAKIFVKSLDGYIVAEKPDRTLIADSLDFENGVESNIHLAYNCIIEPNLKDKEAQEAFGVHTPKEFLQVILSDGEISFIAEKLIELAGYKKDNIRLIEDIKN